MLKYKVISDIGGKITWDVHIFMNPHADVGTYIREIKESPSHFYKEIKVYRKGIEVAGAAFEGKEPIYWHGKASEIWAAPVEKCELTSEQDYVFKIYIKEPREGAYVCVFPFIPKLLDKVRLPLPQGGYTVR